jgi:hypothetical protein
VSCSGVPSDPAMCLSAPIRSRAARMVSQSITSAAVNLASSRNHDRRWRAATLPCAAPPRYSQVVAKDYLLLISDREPLAWVLKERRMAFPTGRSRLVSQLAEGDRLFVYTTRGCFRNPTRDRGRVIGETTVTSPVVALDEPVVFGDRSFGLGCNLHPTGLAPRGAGPELRALVDRMHVFPDPKTWSVRLRQVLVPLDKHDAGLLHRELEPLMQSLETHMADYSQAKASLGHR